LFTSTESHNTQFYFKMTPKSATMKSSSSNGTESAPVLVNQRRAPSETSSVQESRRKASEEWKEAEQVMKKMLKHAEVYSQMDGFIQDYTRQKEKADCNEKRIEELETSQKLQIDGFAQKCNEWQEKEKELNRKVEHVERNNRNNYSEEIRGLKGDLEAAGKETLSLQSQLATTRQDCKEATDELDIWRKKIQRYEQDLAQLDDTALETQ
jgi:chromosome segregation ATPase